ncbi:O-acetyl-ADP-ribose deacetylase (regulator of RNase III), contains Macro domain [Flexibacter flexilis DSM 6793]|uniref:Protein-ADP-ribose hydrolase n=1 Tax=Flexibacter flexilis DSM 6793 TaxID=927664 RepID=A0A1I1L982_9BACT|nr:protein-ADP-ribose hydrolase [Flexibacter flexilis]SFC67598.1 O-acetyl-ADP-ribose deacetylase (regulator of RNase III), contains Macro domain [Flexibacter flexilis DSM 6793]
MTETEILDQLLLYFETKTPQTAFRNLEKRERLKAYLTVWYPSEPLPAAVMELADRLFAQEAARLLVTEAATLPRLSAQMQGTAYPSAGKCSLWKGDITTLRADAIVNAANEQMLGCFTVFHKCIDNAIHSVAGPRLREACYGLMSAQGHPEPTGSAKITKGFSLPASYVLHTVGPIVRSGLPTATQQAQLADCYTQCLDLAAQNDQIRSVAFCCISTGVFGYPAHLAVTVALQAVHHWLASHPDSQVQHVVFNVFSEADYHIYQKAIEQWPQTL